MLLYLCRAEEINKSQINTVCPIDMTTSKTTINATYLGTMKLNIWRIDKLDNQTRPNTSTRN